MSSQIVRIIDIAKGYIGMKELPANSNNVIFNMRYYGVPVSGPSYPWFALLSGACFRTSERQSCFTVVDKRRRVPYS